MKIIVLGSGMMGRALAYDLDKYSKFESITIADNDKETLQSAKKSLNISKINFQTLNVEKTNDVRKCFQEFDIAISAVPYKFNYEL